MNSTKKKSSSSSSSSGSNAGGIKVESGSTGGATGSAPVHEPFRTYASAAPADSAAALPHLANQFDVQEDPTTRANLGTLSMLPDQLILNILARLRAPDLCALAQCCRVANVFASEETLWKPLVIKRYEGAFRFRGSWKRTLVFGRYAPAPDMLPPVRAPGFCSSHLYRMWYRSNVSTDHWAELPKDLPVERQVPRVSVHDLSYERFMTEFAHPSKPVIITDLVTQWPAWTEKRWTIENLLKRFGSTKFKTDEVDSKADRKLFLGFDDYVEYMRGSHDEDPIYLFDDKFGDRPETASLLDDYEIPQFFKPDVFEYLGEERPPYRWLVLGPNRSGSGFHLDPYRTSAWNALLVGRKRWAFYPFEKFPPGAEVEWDREVKPDSSSSSSETVSSTDSSDGENEAVRSRRIRKRQKRSRQTERRQLRERAKAWAWEGDRETVHTFDADAPEPIKWHVEHYGQLPDHLKPIECFLEAGELIFVPGGWWHAVLNIGDTIAVTQNFVNNHNIHTVAAEIDFDDQEFYNQFRDCVTRNEPNRKWEDRRVGLKTRGPFKD